MDLDSPAKLFVYLIGVGLALWLVKKRGVDRRGLVMYGLGFTLPLLVFQAVEAGALPVASFSPLSVKLLWGGIVVFVFYCSLRAKALMAFVLFLLGVVCIWLNLPALMTYSFLFATIVWVLLFGKLAPQSVQKIAGTGEAQSS